MVARAPHPAASICQDCLAWPCPLSDTFPRTHRFCPSVPIPCLPAGLTSILRHPPPPAACPRSGTHRQLRKPRVSTLHEFGLFLTHQGLCLSRCAMTRPTYASCEDRRPIRMSKSRYPPSHRVPKTCTDVISRSSTTVRNRCRRRPCVMSRDDDREK